MCPGDFSGLDTKNPPTQILKEMWVYGLSAVEMILMRLPFLSMRGNELIISAIVSR